MEPELHPPPEQQQTELCHQEAFSSEAHDPASTTQELTQPKAPPEKEVSEADIRHALHELLKAADLNKVTEKLVRKQVEKELGTDLSTKKGLIRKEIEAWLDSQQEGQGEEEEEEENEEVAEDKHSSRKGKRKVSSSLGGEGKARGGFGKACLLSPALSALVGAETMARSQVVKALWDYIKKHELQDPKNRRNIICDEKLKTIFTPPVNMFSMNKQLTKHVFQSDGTEPSPKGTEEEEEEEEEDGSEEEKPRAKKAKKEKKGSGEKKSGGGGNGFTKPVKLLGPLSDFFGGETELSRPDITKRMWEYFKENNLKNPDDGREIICNDELRNLLGVDRFMGFGIQKLLKPYIG